MKLTSKIFWSTPYASTPEQTFCDKKLQERRVELTFYTYVLTLVLVFFVPLVSYFGVSNRRHLDEILVTHIATGLLLLTRPVFKKIGVKLVHFMLPISLFYISSLAILMRSDIANGWDHTGSTMLTAFVLVGFLMFTAVHHLFWQLCLCLWCYGVFAWGLWDSPDGRSSRIIFASAVFSAVALRNAMEREARDRYMVQFRSRARHIPQNILTKSALSGKPINELFRPLLRECICISSDWRNYQNLAGRLPEESLAGLLSAYYARVNALLASTIMSGNYFVDWIADELFVVLYVEPDGPDLRELNDQALQLCQRIIAVRNEFWREHHAPEAIDFGLAAGKAYVGIIGPEGHTKATALGELPGRARRIQTFGKKLREDHGAFDRIIFGADVKQLIQDDKNHVVEQVEAVGQIRDVNESAFYFISAKQYSAARS